MKKLLLLGLGAVLGFTMVCGGMAAAKEGKKPSTVIDVGFSPAFTDTSQKPLMGEEVCHGYTQEVLSGV
jgi:hypothetical protein